MTHKAVTQTAWATWTFYSTQIPLCFMASIPSQAWQNASDPFISQLTSGYQGLPASSCLSLKETNAPDTHLAILLCISSTVPVSSFMWATFFLQLQHQIFLLLTFQILECTQFFLNSCAPSSPVCSFHCSGGWYSWFGKVNSMVTVKSPYPLKVSP